jgi:hypothetical protein
MRYLPRIARGLFLPFLVALFVTAAGATAAEPTRKAKGLSRAVRKGIMRTFHRLKLGIRQENELYFKSGWVPLGYEKNLTGGRASMKGRAFFDLYARRRWLIRPKLDQVQSLPGRTGRPYLVPCLIWSGNRHKALATLHALLVYSDKRSRWKVLGASGRKADVVALGQRYINKKLPSK